MSHDDFATEPVPGLPEKLPQGEAMLWRGAPDFSAFAWRGMHLRGLSVYFGVLLIWYATWVLAQGTPLREAALGTGRLVALALLALGLITLFAWMVARSTIYTITTRRVVMRFGIALTMTLNIPFKMIEGAGLRMRPDGTGDITLTVGKGARLAYLMLWPHVRPWRLAASEPMLRSVPQAERVAQCLGRALASAAGQPVPMIGAAGPVTAGAQEQAAAA